MVMLCACPTIGTHSSYIFNTESIGEKLAQKTEIN